MRFRRISSAFTRLLALLAVPLLGASLALGSPSAQATKQKATKTTAAKAGKSKGSKTPKTLPRIHPVGPKLPPPPAATGGECALQWQITPVLDAQPRRLDIAFSFNPDGRSQTTLSLPGGWAGVDDSQGNAELRLNPVADNPALRTVNHGPNDRVHLRWSLTPPAAGSAVQLTTNWFALVGLGALPVPIELDDNAPPATCIRLAMPEGRTGTTRWASSHGAAEGPSVVLKPVTTLAPVRQRIQQALYAGGAIEVQTTETEGQPVITATPGDSGWSFTPEALAKASSQAVGVQRRYWGDTAATRTPLLVLALPAVPGQLQPLGTAWHQAVAIQAPSDMTVPGKGFDAVITPALVRTWIPDRIGPAHFVGRDDSALRAWFHEGFADYLAHRSLLREGSWTPDDYAAELQRGLDTYLQSPDRRADNLRLSANWPRNPDLAALPPVRGEWLALTWHNQLRANGHAGLDVVLKRLLVPAAQARHDGPLSAPLATHRLVAGLRQEMGDAALRDVMRYIDQGDPFNTGTTALGPCFEGSTEGVQSRPVFKPVAQAGQQAACQGWLGLGPLAQGTGQRSSAAAPASAASAAKGKGGKASKSTARKPTKAASKAPAKAKASPSKAQ